MHIYVANFLAIDEGQRLRITENLAYKHEETSSLVRVMFYLRCICSCKLVTRTQTFKIRSNYVAFLFFWNV